MKTKNYIQTLKINEELVDIIFKLKKSANKIDYELAIFDSKLPQIMKDRFLGDNLV